MADPSDELERILAETHARLNEIRLEVPLMEKGGPEPPSPQSWAAQSLSPAFPRPTKAPRPAPMSPPPTPAFPPAMAPADEPPPPVYFPPTKPKLRPAQAPPGATPASEAKPPAERPYFRDELALPSVELPPPPSPSLAPVAAPSESASPASAATRPVPLETLLTPEYSLSNEPDAPALRAPLSSSVRGMLGAAALLTVAVGVWWSFPSTRVETTLPAVSFDAISAHEGDQWLVSRQRDLLLYDAGAKSRVVADLPRPLTSMVWSGGMLYGTDGKNTLFRWERLDAPPEIFTLDHAPVAIFARLPHVWTLDVKGNLRQFLLARSMTGMFLQPLDLDEILLPGDFNIADDGTLVVLERSTGNLIRLARDKAVYAVTSRGTSYGPGARLASSGRGLWIARADGEKTSLTLVPSPR